MPPIVRALSPAVPRRLARRRQQWRAAVLTALCLLPAGCAPRSGSAPTGTDASPGATAFIGVTVLAMVDGHAPLRDQTVVVIAGRIAAVGPTASVPVPTAARVVDGRGRFLMPGLADMHVHLEYTTDPGFLAHFLANGVTTVRSMDGRPYIREWRDSIARGEMMGPTIITAGPILDGDPPARDDNVRIATAAEARTAVVQQKAAGYDFIKLYTNLSADAFGAIARTAREQGLKVAGHVPRALPFGAAITGGLHSLEHLSDVARVIEADDSPFAGRGHWAKSYLAMPVDSARMDSVALAMAAAGVWVVPTLVERERGLADSATVHRWLTEPALAALPAEWLDAWSGQLRRSTRRMEADDWRLVADGSEHRAAMLRALHRSGVRLLVGSDTPNAFVAPGMSVHEELALWVGAGIPVREALAAATRGAARFFGEEGQWGTIQAGARADLVLLAADPLVAVANTRRIDGVMVRGQWLAVDSLQQLVRPPAR